MITVSVKLVGGPFDGQTRQQPVLSDWHSLELQIRRDPFVHVYFGRLMHDEQSELQYVGVREGVDDKAV